MTVYNDLAVIILAAGKGTRMKSDLAKVLHPVAGKSMVNHVIDVSSQIAPDHIHVVIGHQAEKVKKEIDQFYTVYYAVQKELLGTGDAVKAALPGIGSEIRHVLVLCGDVPLIQTDTLVQFVNGHIQEDAGVTVLSTKVKNPTGYGRIITDDSGQLLCIREEADATEIEKKIDIVNTGIYCFDIDCLSDNIQMIIPDNNQAEYYLTDVVEITKKNKGRIVSILMDDPDQVMGVNTLTELDKANTLFEKYRK